MGAATGGVRERLKSRFMAIGVLIAAVFGSLDGEVVEHAGAFEQTVCGSSQRESVHNH